MPEDEEKAILELWKSNERKRFGEIRRELSKTLRYRYDVKQIARYLNRLVEKGLLYKWEDEKGPYYVPRDAPFIREYRLSSFFNKIREYAVDKGWFIDKDIGLVSGITRIGFYGIPGLDSMTHLEEEMLGVLAMQIRSVFVNYESLCCAIATRIEKHSERKPYSFYGDLFWDYLFYQMVEQGKVALCFWDDMGINELLSMVPDFLDFMNEMREKYGWKGRHEIREKALDVAKGLLELPNDLEKAGKIPVFDAESFDPNMMALIATHSPRTLKEYALHPENKIMEWWTKSDGTEFASEEIREIIEMEKQGIDIIKEQEKRGVLIEDMCLGLEDLSRYFTAMPYLRGLSAFKIRLDDDIVARLKKWEWLLEKIGQENIDRLIQLVKLRDNLRI